MNAPVSVEHTVDKRGWTVVDMPLEMPMAAESVN
jgi:hypothetical protein